MKKETSKLKFFGLNRLMPYLKPFKWLFISMMAAQVFVGVLGIIIPLFQKYAIDNFIAKNTLAGFGPFVAAYAVCLVVYMIIGYVADFNSCKIEMYILRDLRRAMFNHLQTLSVSYFNQNSVGYIHSRVMSDTSVIGMVLAWDTNMGIWAIVYLLGATAVMFALNPVLAVCAVCIAPVAALISILFKKKLAALQHKVRESNSAITSDFNEVITGAATGKTLAIEDKLNSEFGEHTSLMKRRSVRQGHYRALFSSVIAFLASASLALVLWYGGVITAEQASLIGTLSLFMTYAQAMCDQIKALVDLFSEFVTVKVNTERIVKLLDEKSEVEDAPEVVEKYGDRFNEKRENWEKIEGRVEFKDVTFRYPDGGENVLEHFNLNVPAGANVAIVGETGAGKSTLVNLLCRFYEPTGGAILIDGKPVTGRSVQWLHSNIGYVLQTPHLFSGTLRENLLYGDLTASEDKIYAAIDSVNARSIVERLGGLDARIGEGGNSLSAGEKQLISFARAILADPAIFILDEATASVDTLTENAVQETVLKLMKGRTSFIIAHRLSTVRTADEILVVSNGKIIERGTHAGLLRARGEYFKLYMQQFKEDQIKKFI